MSAFAMPASAAVAAIVASSHGRRPDSPRSMTGKGGTRVVAARLGGHGLDRDAHPAVASLVG